MKRAFTIIAILLVVSYITDHVRTVNAQSIGASPTTASTLAGCPVPVANFMNFCQVTNDPVNASGVYVTSNGAAYFLLQKAGLGGVATFNGRSGNVLPALNDYAYLDLKNKPTTISCTTSSQSNTGLTASGCIFQ